MELKKNKLETFRKTENTAISFLSSIVIRIFTQKEYIELFK